MAQPSRRAVVSLLLAAPAAALLGCTATAADANATVRAATSTPTGATASLGSPAGLPQGPLANAGFGPNGSHWPSRTPRPSDRFDLVVEAECNWGAIGKAIAYVTERTTEGKGAVLVKPGTLPGNGAGSSSTPVLQLVGQADRSYRVLVAPRDGSGSVTHTGSLRIDRVKGVSFVGFWPFPNSVVLTSVEDVAWAWSKGQAFNVTAGKGGPARRIELVECVTPELKITESDAWAFRTAGSALEDVAVVGCYVAPSYKPAGSAAHCDTLQLSGDKPQTTVTVRDSVIFASTNAAFIPSAIAAGVMFDHSLVVGGDRMLQRFPVPPEANAFTSGFPSAVNGSGTVGILSARNSTFIGPVRGEWATVESTTVSGSNLARSATGGFTSDPSLSSIDATWLEKVTPVPTDERLRAVWAL
ncbi:hypothetical protein [Microbacterium trichothecenolyticum]|uniref:Uncharacterized protein n=1 Tax=Microbacterium trichothecenolyticum TaxID=69370 RepID=A0A0M2H8P3_MICTR|nr:hypothetical protein [Microbacterium trichothecenolyticum]KJL40331.1 hypothetical protein RS82_03660 [Microbacterium trichothecenolyticum]